MANIFVSYDHDDTECAAWIASALENAGHSVWWDRHIYGGAEYTHEIERAVEKADAVVVLWSARSVRSAWVRDEAAEGRDQAKLIPVLIDPVKPPMGFRQFQMIDLSRSKRSPSDTSLQQILDSINALSGVSRPRPPEPAAAKSSKRFGPIRWQASLAAAVLMFVALAGVLGSRWLNKDAVPVIAVTASDSAPRSQALSRDLSVKLGTLAQVGASKWELADPQSAPSNPDLIFRAADVGSAARPKASLVLLDGKRNSVLWSREFTHPDATEADLRQQVALTAGRALDCVLTARQAGGLRPDLLKLFLGACAEAEELSDAEPDKLAGTMRTIVEQQPRFAPAWAGLLAADVGELALAETGGSGIPEARKALAHDIERTRAIVPELPEIELAEIQLLPADDYAGALKRITQVKGRAAEKAGVWLFESKYLQRVGRMSEAIESAKRGAELDPLSPSASTQLIFALAYGGRIDLAKEELQHAERRWPGTGQLRDAQFGFHLRFGDPKIARALSGSPANPYFRARLDPTPDNVAAAVAHIKRFSNPNIDMAVIQNFGEFHRTDEVFAWLDRTPPSTLVGASYVLFRPSLAEARRDPRFMTVAKRAGLLRYWRESDKWPDFCFEPNLPYDCKKEAAKLAA